jgi:deazaflavin-dependent oxidoreductase (nitroreductase family)
VVGLVYGSSVRITLTTTGRRSGAPREAELYAFPDGAGLVVTGSWGGAARHPAWALNLRARPTARVRRGRDETGILAREATGAERERLWRLVTDAFPMYATYQRRTMRRFPIFVLEPLRDPDVT